MKCKFNLREAFIAENQFKSCHGFLNSVIDISFIFSVADRMKPEHFGLSADLEFLKASSPVKGTPTIAFTTIYNCDNFSVRAAILVHTKLSCKIFYNASSIKMLATV